MPYRTPKHVQEQKDAKRRHILDAALKVFAEKGYHETSVRDICTAAGVSVGSIYFYFDNKDKIYEAIYDEIMNALLTLSEDASAGERDLSKVIEKVIRATVTFLTSNPHIARFFRTNYSYVSGFKRKRDDALKVGAAELEKMLDREITQGRMQPVNTRLAAVTVTGSVYNLIRYWNLSGCEEDVEELVSFLVEYNLRGLGIDS